ncbi:hypothetical protein NY96_13425 [Xanthomonas citri pv. fuscans]|uniref:hypothetical protein n=1 Tax=Xanthomonas TaxID=338 RepID=UPI0002F24529|nr:MULTISPECIES: hypothetical protein [Xanthomonas]KGT55141.1 hypothetical protein NY96_13425 [Xanthomonas citri pv. fuscans]
MKKNDYSLKRDQIIEAMRGVAVVPKGRRLVRYTHGWEGPATNRGLYYIGYQWSRTHANHMTGMVYDVVIARGTDFGDALDKAIAAMKRKRAKVDEVASTQ